MWRLVQGEIGTDHGRRQRGDGGVSPPPPPDSEFRVNSLLEIVIFKEKNSECMPKF